MDLISAGAVADWLGRWGYVIVFFAPMLEILVPMIPGEIVMILAGYLAAQGRLSLAGAISIAGAGAMAGVSVSFGLGKAFGFPLVERYGHWVFVTRRHLKRVNRWFHRWGEPLLVLGYFIPSVRHVVAFVAGTARLRWTRFAAIVYPGGVVWAATFILLGYFFGRGFLHFVETYYEWIGVGIGALLLAALAWWILERRRRRRSAGGEREAE